MCKKTFRDHNKSTDAITFAFMWKPNPKRGRRKKSETQPLCSPGTTTQLADSNPQDDPVIEAEAPVEDSNPQDDPVLEADASVAMSTESTISDYPAQKEVESEEGHPLNAIPNDAKRKTTADANDSESEPHLDQLRQSKVRRLDGEVDEDEAGSARLMVAEATLSQKMDEGKQTFQSPDQAVRTTEVMGVDPTGGTNLEAPSVAMNSVMLENEALAVGRVVGHVTQQTVEAGNEQVLGRMPSDTNRRDELGLAVSMDPPNP